MSRQGEIISFINNDIADPVIIEPSYRLDDLKKFLDDAIGTYNPAVIVKAGIGSGELLKYIAENLKGYLVVVEPSYSAIEEFCTQYKTEKFLESINFVNSDFNDFAVDYYKADLLICVDYFDFIETGKAVDEFRRACQFDGILILSGIILHDDDMEGIYDDFMHEIFPLHNDYYLEIDLKTFLDLNDFSFVKGYSSNWAVDLQKKITRMSELFGPDLKGKAESYIEQNRDDLKKFYNYNDYKLDEPYFMGLFMRRKPDPDQKKI